MFTEADIQRFIRRSLYYFTTLFTILAVLQIGISFWKNWNICKNHYSDKVFATSVECPKLKSEHLRLACHEAHHGLSLSPFLCGLYETADDVKRIMWMDEFKMLLGNLWFALLLAFVLGLAVLYCALFRNSGSYPAVSVVYPNSAWMQAYQNKNSNSQPSPSSYSFDRPGLTTPAKSHFS